jgi:DNA-binding NarL/FixJ family response regulator
MLPTSSPRPRPIRIVLADDQDMVRCGLKALLSLVPGVDVIADARDGRELVTLVADLAPDIAITDLSMPGMDGLSAVAELHRDHPKVRLLVVSMFDTLDYVKRAVANGACGYLMKDASPLELERAVHAIMSGGAYFSPRISQGLLGPVELTSKDRLTTRQIEILTQIALGRASKEIGFSLGISAKTVDVHRARIMERLDIHSIACLTLYALRQGHVSA